MRLFPLAAATLLSGILAGCSTGTLAQVGSVPDSREGASRVPAAGSELSGEKFSSAKAASSCSSSSGSFEASGKASGPFPGTFTARGTVTVMVSTGAFTYHEHFEIKSGSRAIVGLAKSQAPSSGSPVFGCSRSGKMAFDAPIIQYRVKKSSARGSGSAGLSSNKKFDESFR
jgi:hypothetical protein